MIRAFALIAVAACTSVPPDDEIAGPYTGMRYRFVVDGFRFPQNNNEARELGDDLNGDRTVENQFGSIMGNLAANGDASTHAADMIASGVIASTVEIQADDLANDDRVGVWFYGADDAPASSVGGRMVDGVFASNRTRDTAAVGAAVLRLPVFADADPSPIELIGMQLDLTPDGRGGFDALVRGGFRVDNVMDAAHHGIVQMLAAEPHAHRVLWTYVDANRDGTVTRAEIEQGLIAALLYPEFTVVVDGEPVELMAAGFAIHLAPCEAGRCVTGAFDRCFDRVFDGDESDLDCGGSCGACPGGATCGDGADCQTGICDGGSCRAPTCTDGVGNGYESEIDCGGTCPGCAFGQRCDDDADCARGACRYNGSHGACY